MHKISLILIMGIFLSCQRFSKNETIKLSPVFQCEIQNKLKKNRYFIYYHHGDCSFCYANLLALQKYFSDDLVVSISSLRNVKLVDSYLEMINFKGVSIIDSMGVFFKENSSYLSSDNLFLIDTTGHVIIKAQSFDEKFKKQMNIISERK